MRHSSELRVGQVGASLASWSIFGAIEEQARTGGTG